ncbi:MAG: hypothetical protein KBG21_09730, partial [Ignavibacteria bacterium]|nr:hypothetical protein [Ignavibacteria bacterium]
MKTIVKYFCIYLFIFSFSLSDVFSQDDCGTADMIPGQGPTAYNFFGGYLKPQRTDISDGAPSQSDATLNMLFVFIQFQDDTIQSGEWPLNQPPTYMNRFLVEEKNGTGQFWNRYKDSSLSDYYQEISKGAFHVTGEARHLITYNTWNYYKTVVGYNGLLSEIYTRLKSDSTINWSKFDRWSRNNTTNNYVLDEDNYLDMMGLFFRYVRSDDFLLTNGAAGEVPLYGPQYTFYANGNDTVKVGTDRNQYGSGFIAKGTSVSGPLPYSRAMGIAIHEYGHYLFSRVHSTTGIMTSNGGISVNDLFMSGYEKYRLGLLDTATVNFGNPVTYNLGDASGRNGSLQILKVPISNTEFFIIENRRKISQWDTYMLGDTSQNDPFRNTGDYGKGVYIYHSNDVNLNYAGNVD